MVNGTLLDQQNQTNISEERNRLELKSTAVLPVKGLSEVLRHSLQQQDHDPWLHRHASESGGPLMSSEIARLARPLPEEEGNPKPEHECLSEDGQDPGPSCESEDQQDPESKLERKCCPSCEIM